MNNIWFRFFLGTPRRAIVTLGFSGLMLVVLVGVIYPPAIHAVAARFAEAFMPLLSVIFNAMMTVGILCVGFWFFIKAVGGGGGKKDKGK